MGNNPKVSIIIPAYNCAKYIVNAVDSVLRQTFEDFELIVIDDGSTDDTQDKLLPYIERIRYVYQEKTGASAARNLGIELSKGDLIAFLDADDFWSIDKLETQICALGRAKDCVLCFSDFSIDYADGTKLHVDGFRKIFPIFNELKIGLEDIFTERGFFINSELGDGPIQVRVGKVWDYLFFGNFILTSTVICRKDALRNIRFDTSLRRAEDDAFFLECANVGKIAVVEKPLSTYLLLRDGKLSGHDHIPELIHNCIRTQEKWLRSRISKGVSRISPLNRGIALSWFRLGYYYLSIAEVKEARSAIRNGISSDRRLLLNYYLLFVSFCPIFILKTAGRIKSVINAYLKGTLKLAHYS